MGADVFQREKNEAYVTRKTGLGPSQNAIVHMIRGSENAICKEKREPVTTR